MPSTKRKAISTDVQRRVRARRESDEGLVEKGSPHSEVETLESAEHSTDEEVTSGSEQEDEDFGSEQSRSTEEAASLSFGALARAQAALQPADSRDANTSTQKQGDAWENNEALERQAGRKDRRDFNRSNKHAPAEISSKKAVTRKRGVVPVAKRMSRDPRFDPNFSSIDEGKFRKVYSFLDDYRDEEMKELKAALKSSKNEDEKEKLKKTLMAMESRKKAQARKDMEREVLDKHRKEEKELVRQGKQPFYLKKPELQKRVLLEQYEQLKGKQIDKVIARRRKKMEGKEKKKLPFKRRTFQS